MAPPKRIALFTGNYNHVADGVSRTLNRLVAYLGRQGIDVLVFGPSVDTPAVDHAGELVVVPSLPAPGRPEYRLTMAMSSEIRRKLDAFAPTIIHIATPDLLGLQARWYASKNEIPLVATYHTHFSSYLSYYGLSVMERTLWTYLRWFYKAFRHIYVPTDSMAEVLHRHGIDQGIEIWPRGVETDRFTPALRSPEWRKRQGLGDEDVVLTYVSRLVWEKAPDVFADVIQRLSDRHTNLRSMMVGDGPAREALAQRLNKTIFPGHLETDELATAYASSDIFLFPSDTETFGNVTLEAMASGLPAICANATGSRSLVLDGQTGYLVPPGDVKAFAQATESLLADPVLRRKMSEAAVARAAAFDWEAVLQKMVVYYDDTLCGR